VPKCGGEVHEKYKKFQCINPALRLRLVEDHGRAAARAGEAETLLREREVGRSEGFAAASAGRSQAKLKLNDGERGRVRLRAAARRRGRRSARFHGPDPAGPCPKCGNDVFETPNAYVCVRAVGEGRTCDFRSGRTILQRPIERAQMEKLLKTGKSDLLQFVSARTRRPFSAYLARQKDGSVGFEFEPKDPARKGARPARAAPLRVLGAHPRDRQPVELHAGRYGPYVKHGTVNATVPDKDQVEGLTLEAAVALLDAKAGRSPTRRTGAATRGRTSRETEVPAYVASAALNASRERTAAARGAVKAKPAATRAPAAKSATTTRRPKAAAPKSKPAAKTAKPATARKPAGRTGAKKTTRR
jgi:DNA topoisomerase-3